MAAGRAALPRRAEARGGGRAAFLSEACADDEGLRREVESLLGYEEQAENFIESPALEVAAKMMAKEHEADGGCGANDQALQDYLPTRSGRDGRSLPRRGHSLGAKGDTQAVARAFHSRQWPPAPVRAGGPRRRGPLAPERLRDP